MSITINQGCAKLANLKKIIILKLRNITGNSWSALATARAKDTFFIFVVEIQYAGLFHNNKKKYEETFKNYINIKFNAVLIRLRLTLG